MRKLTISLFSLALALPAAAQELPGDVDPEEAEVRRYTVEVIIFRYAQDVGTDSEVFPRDEPEPVESSLDESMELVGQRQQQPRENPEPLPDTEFVLLDRADFQMGEIMGRMERLDVYDPVMHFGWTQATWPEEQTEAISLHRFARPPAGLNGKLTLYLNRFLHLVVDLELEAPNSESFNVREPERVGNRRTVSELLGEVNPQLPAYYRIQEDRILKNGELRYYDHPKFGVLARVTRIEEEEDGVTELLGYGTE